MIFSHGQCVCGVAVTHIWSTGEHACACHYYWSWFWVCEAWYAISDDDLSSAMRKMCLPNGLKLSPLGDADFPEELPANAGCAQARHCLSTGSCLTVVFQTLLMLALGGRGYTFDWAEGHAWRPLPVGETCPCPQGHSESVRGVTLGCIVGPWYTCLKNYHRVALVIFEVCIVGG